jgi:hypothetical protein
MSQTMLLTKRLALFLSQNISPQLHTLILISPTGKLLCSSSPSPASTLRTQATLAVSLWNLYHPFNISASILVTSSSTHPAHNDLACITIQLEYGIMYIRSLVSGLLFVAIGPSSIPSSSLPSSQLLHAQQSLSIGEGSTSPPLSPHLKQDETHGSQASSQAHGEGTTSGGGSEAGSAVTERGAHASIWSVRRHAEEVGRLLEEKLGGFVLSSGDGR